MAITARQQQTIDELVARMRADGWDNARLDVRALADEVAEFGTFDEDEVEAAGEGAIVVFRDFDDTDAVATCVEFEVPDRGLVIAADGRIVV